MAIEKIRMPDGTEIIVDEWIAMPRYSTIEWAAGIDVNLRAFTYVVGANVPQQGAVPGGVRVSTQTDTNQTTRTRLNRDQAFLAYSLTFEAFGLSTGGPAPQVDAPAPAVSANNFRRMQRDLVLSLVIGANIQKPQARMPFSWAGQGPGAKLYPSSGTMGADQALSVGSAGGGPSPKNQRSWRLPVYIAPDRVFYVETKSHRAPRDASTGTLDQAIRLRLYIDGLNRRPLA